MRPRRRYSLRVTDAERTELVERFIGAFDGRWPEDGELEGLLTDDVEFVERPSLVSPKGNVRDRDAILAGVDAGRALLASQRYEIRDHLVRDDQVVTRFRWTGETAIDAGPWPAGTKLVAWCVAHYQLRDGRIARIEQHDCYEPAQTP